ncbi:MAG: hypothetical protein ABJ051_11900 [Lentilitoribacter sp.]
MSPDICMAVNRSPDGESGPRHNKESSDNGRRSYPSFIRRCWRALMNFEAFVNSYGEIMMGLVVGALAHFGLRIDKKENLTWRALLGYTLQLGFIGLLSTIIVHFLAIETPEIKIFIAALMAVAGRDAVEYVRDKYKKPIDQALRDLGSDEGLD